MSPQPEQKRIGDDLEVTYVEPGRGTWVLGTVCGHDFAAKMYNGHALMPQSEIERSHISKLSLRRLEDERLVFKWERGLEDTGKDPLGKERLTEEIVRFLTSGVLNQYGLKKEAGRSQKSDRKRSSPKPGIEYER